MRRSHRSQRGVILLMLLIALTLIIIAMGVAAPKLSQAIKRDREVEMIHRGAQYARAVKRYYKKFGRYPASIEQLENTNNIRFLRRAYTDPMSKDGKWRPVRFGEIQFGQQGGPGMVGGTGGALPQVVGSVLNQGGMSTQGPATQPSTGQQPSDSSSSTSSNTSSGSSFGSQSSSGFGNGQPSSGFGQPGQTFGGGAILGVASTSQAVGFHEYNQKSKYNQWFFVYDPTVDRGGLITGPYNPKAFVGQAAVGTPAGQQPSPPTFGSPGFTNSPGTSPSQPTPSPTNQSPQ